MEFWVHLQNEMAKQKFCPTRLGGFSGVKAYIEYVKVLKNHCNAVGRTFCDAINVFVLAQSLAQIPPSRRSPAIFPYFFHIPCIIARYSFDQR